MKRKARTARKRVRETAPVDLTAHTRLLLDTQVWVWWKAADPRLGPVARKAIQDAGEVRFSAASAWEIAIKVGVGKLRLPYHGGLKAELAKHGFLPLPIEMEHAMGVATLPRIHRDPFDRLLVSQALAERLTIVTADAIMSRYPAAFLPAME